MLELSDAALAGSIGLAGGVLLGLAARIGRFCTLGAIEDALYAHDYRRARMWGVALAVAIFGVFALNAVGSLDLGATIYARSTWNPFASLFGGAVFGYGMAMAGNCGHGALARAGGGALQSVVVVVVMGVAALATIAGPLSALRLALFPVEIAPLTAEPVSAAHVLGAAIGVAPLAVAGAASALILSWSLWSAPFRRSLRHVFWGAVVGVAIVSGWWGTAYVAATGFDATATESHKFTAPLGQALLYLMTSASGVGFGVGSVTGVILGGLIGGLALGQFRWEACDDPRELGRQMLGAAMMGVGGVVALGCSIGQGLTAFSTLAWSAPVVALSIVMGARLGLRHLIEGAPSFPRLRIGVPRARKLIASLDPRSPR